MSGSNQPDDEQDPVAEPQSGDESADEEADVDAAGGGAGSEPRTVADNAETVQDPDAPAPAGEQAAATRRHAERLERHSERERAPIEPSAPSPPGSPRETPR